jgi:hypothetical protein
MDRDDLITLLSAIEEDTLTVRLDGTLVLENGSDWNPDDVEAAVAELTAELASLLKWAKLAPEYPPPDSGE